jgi:hypothetical protein
MFSFNGMGFGGDERTGANGYAATSKNVKKTQAENENYPIAQGFAFLLGANGNVTNQKMPLNAPGKRLLGFNISAVGNALVPIVGVAVTLKVNNYSIIVEMSGSAYDPTEIHSIQFFPTIQPLSGTDDITISLSNSTANAYDLRVGLLYVPQ